jgi:hypothetical protein
MSASSLADKATDLLNQAKLSSSAQDKLFNLEQIKEIILHRDQSLFPSFLEDITDFMIDKAVSVRKFLVAFGGEVISKFPQHIPAILKLFSFLVADESDSVVRAVLAELARHYGRVAMHVVSLDTRSNQSFFVKTSKSQSPKELWDMLKRMERSAVETLSTRRSGALKEQCLKLSASVLLFSLPLDAFSADRSPHAANKRHQSDYQSAYNVASVSLHHAFLSKDIIEGEARTFLTKLTIWATRGGPQGFPFSEEQMGELAVTLAEVALQRPRVARSILPAVTFLVFAMAGREGDGERESPLKLPEEHTSTFVDLATALALSLQTSGAAGELKAESDEGVRKLTDALAALAALAAAAKAKAKTPAAGARGAQGLLSNLLQMDESEEDEDEPLEQAEGGMGADDVDDDDNDLRIKNRAIQAINLLETSAAGASLPGEAGSSIGLGSLEAQGQVGQGVAEVNRRDTVLSEDAPAFPDAAPPSLWALATGAAKEVVFRPSDTQTQMTPDGYFGVSFSHLRSLLCSGLQASANMNEKVGAIGILSGLCQLYLTDLILFCILFCFC